MATHEGNQMRDMFKCIDGHLETISDLRAQLAARDEALRNTAKSLHVIAANPGDVSLAIEHADRALATIRRALGVK